MKALVVGTGSIGKRHLANLIRCGVEVSAYSYRVRAMERDDFLAEIPRVAVLDAESLAEFDAVVIANRTDQHIPVARLAIKNSKSIFIEKPLSASLLGVDELCKEAHSNNCCVEAGYMLRFHPNLIWLRQYIQQGGIGEVMYIRAAVGQYLPDWRPGTDHTVAYSALRCQGGGVILDLIHELDVIRWLGGEVREVSAMTRYVPQLNIETEAIAEISLSLESGVLAQVHLDYVYPGYYRRLEVVGSHGVATWDYVAGEVRVDARSGGQRLAHSTPSGFERNALFLNHIQYFLNRHNDANLPAASSLEDSLSVLRIALAAHQSAEQNCRVRPAEVNTNYRVRGYK